MALIGGDAGNNTLNGTSSADTMGGAAGNDTINGLGGFDIIVGGIGRDTIDGGDATDIIFDNDGYYITFEPIVDSDADVLRGGAGDDFLLGGVHDRYEGGAGSDAATIVVLSGTAFNVDFSNITTQPNVSLALPGGGAVLGIERVEVRGSYVADRIIGSANNDTLRGGGGDDSLTGGGGVDRLFGESGADTITGGLGADSMTGGDGADTYVVDNAADVAIEAANVETDSVFASVSYTLGVYVENLTLTGSAALSGSGNSGDNALTGNSAANSLNGAAGNDVLDGKAGADTMIGGDGDDTYTVGSGADVTTESSALGGEDTVLSAVSRTLGANLENLSLFGTATVGLGNELYNEIIGNAQANTLSGFGGNDILNGGAGADTMTGGEGSDWYYIGSSADRIVETGTIDSDNDTVYSAINYTLAANLEDLYLTGAALTGVGNELGNWISGNAEANTLTGLAGDDHMNGLGGTDSLTGGDGADWLDGGSGVDTMIGGDGDDRYTVSSNSDVTLEASALGGEDTVYSYVSRTLGANLENLVLYDLAANGTGNALTNEIIGSDIANILIGGEGADTLNGGLGVDTLVGGNGDDVYVTDQQTDSVSETGTGIDEVRAEVSWQLGANLENLTLLAGGDLNGTGNGLANIITGNNQENMLSGGGGNDTLIGGVRADTLTGGTGADKFVFDDDFFITDVLTDFSLAESDSIQLDHNVFTSLSAGALNASNFVVGSSAVDADDYIIYDSTTGALYYDEDGSGGNSARNFATLTAGLALAETDFLII